MKLLLMRHAEASERAATDVQRRLTEEGMAAVIRQSNNTALPWHEFTSLWVSPYVRTQQTASLLLEHYHQKKHSLSIQRLDCITPHGDINEVQNFFSSKLMRA